MSGFVFYRGYVYRRNLSYHIKLAHGRKEFKGTNVDHSKELASEVSAFMYIKCSVDSVLDYISQIH
jgi:hypothetical protein